MQKTNDRKLWHRWEEEVKKFKNVLNEYPPPAGIIRQWRRHLLFIFMKEMSKNVLNEQETFDSLVDRIIEAIQVGCGFECVRIYLVDEREEREIYLSKTSKRHDPVKKEELRLKVEKGIDIAVDTLFSGEPLFLEDAAGAKLVFGEYLNLKGPYIAIPLIVEGNPIGLICASISYKAKPGKSILKYPEYFEQIDTFARHIMEAIKNREIFDQRNQKIEQFKLVKEFNELIESETEKEKLLDSFMKHCIELAHADGGHLKLYNPDTEKLERVADYGADVAPPEIRHKPMDIGFSNLVFKKGKAFLINDLQKNPLMKKHKDYCKKEGHNEYLKRLEQRESALIVPLIKHTGEIYGVLDLHSKSKSQFTETDKDNLLALGSSVTYAVDKVQQLEWRSEIIKTRENWLTTLQSAVKEAHNLKSVLEIIRNHCYSLKFVKDIESVCLSIKDPYSNELTTPSVKCVRKDKDCNLCFRENKIIQDAFRNGKILTGKNNLAFPISLKEDVIGVLYLQGYKKVVLTDEEKELLKIITNTAAILIKTARDYEKKIKQSAALYELGKLSAKTRDFREWFSPLMERVMDIIGRESRNFHLVMVESVDGIDKLFIRVTSPIFTENEIIQLEDKLLGLELPMDQSLSGMVAKEKVPKYIPDVEKNEKKKDSDPTKLKYHDDGTGIRAEVGIPLKIKEGDIEKVLGVLIIDSIIPNDFITLDWEFVETIANYLAIAIHNQQLHEERTRFQIELSRTDRTTELSIFLNSFFHDIKNPLSEMNSAINLIDMYSNEGAVKTYIQKAKDLSHRILYIYEEFVNNFAKSISKRETKDLKKLIENAITTVEKTVGLRSELKGNYKKSDIVINCFPAYIELAFRSIINNAVKFSSGLQQVERYLDINVKPNNKNNFVIILFESSTIDYLPEDKLKTIFKPFEQVITRESSTGLGLSLADLCIKLHGGEIKANNVEDKKSVRFEITLPMDKVQEVGV